MTGGPDDFDGFSREISSRAPRRTRPLSLAVSVVVLALGAGVVSVQGDKPKMHVSTFEAPPEATATTTAEPMATQADAEATTTTTSAAPTVASRVVTTTTPSLPLSTTTTPPNDPSEVFCSEPEYRGISYAAGFGTKEWATWGTTGISTSEDRGATWTFRCPVIRQRVLTRIHPLNERQLVGIAEGVNGVGFEVSSTLAYSDDGGASWNEAAGAASIYRRHLADLSFNGLDGWALANLYSIRSPSRSELLHTTDGGRTWTTIVIPQGVGIQGTAISFVDAKRGYLTASVSKPGIWMFETVDGGLTWNDLALPPEITSAPTSVIASGDNIYSSVSQARGELQQTTILVSADRGRTWSSTGFRDHAGFDLGEAQGGAAIVGVGGREGGGPAARIVRSIDAGRTWEDAVVPDLAVTLRTLSISGEQMWATGNGKSIVSVDTGRTWITRSVPPPVR